MACVEMAMAGESFQEIADSLGLNRNSVRQTCAKYGIREYRNKKPPMKVDRDLAIELLKSGLKPKDVAEKIGCSTSRINTIAKECGLSLVWRDVQDERIRAYRLEGHTFKECGEAFGVSETTAFIACKGMEFKLSCKRGPRDGKWRNQFYDGIVYDFDGRIRRVTKQVKSINPKLEYVRGLEVTGAKHAVFRCLDCGCEKTIRLDNLKHDRALPCEVCSHLEKIRHTLRIDTFMWQWQADERKQIKRVRAKCKRKPHEVIYDPHPCAVCGKITTRKKYCSSDCARKASNAQHDVKKRKFLKDKVIDKDITLKKLFNRDRGVCWICGQMCDYGDYERKNGYFVAGNRYPSIDHVIPRCEGGEHSWANIKLAHRICNTASFKWMKKDSTKRHIAV